MNPVKVEKGWLMVTTEEDLPARICAANVTGIVSIHGRMMTRVYFASKSIEVVENGTSIQEALDEWYARPKTKPATQIEEFNDAENKILAAEL